jgi:hypothetical protein
LEDNIEINIGKIVFRAAEWIRVAQNKGKSATIKGSKPSATFGY